VFGDGLPFQVEGWRGEWPDLDIVGTHTVHADFERAALSAQPDVLLVELPALQPTAAERIQDLAFRASARRVVLVYGFAPSTLLDKLNRQGVVTLRAPASAADIEEACRLPRPGRPAAANEPGAWADEVPPRRYDGEILAAVARSATRLRCECPQHLTDLLFRLGAFELYSGECETRNAEDAELHACLRQAAGQARALLEDALERLLKMEGLEALEARPEERRGAAGRE
jgi:hypothetical protein